VTDRTALLAIAAASNGHRGSARLLQVLSEHVPGTTVTRSELEERMLLLCRAHGLPRPLVNHHVEGIEVDFVFRGARLLVEADSWRYHRDRDAFERDRERDAIFARAGYRVLRFTDRQMRSDPHAVAATIAALMR
jgi:very-short-patch-repair endonuclease